MKAWASSGNWWCRLSCSCLFSILAEGGLVARRRPNPLTTSCAQLPQVLRATICSTQSQGRRANSLRSNKRGSVGPLRGPQPLGFPCFKAAADERKPRCGGSGCSSGPAGYCGLDLALAQIDLNSWRESKHPGVLRVLRIGSRASGCESAMRGRSEMTGSEASRFFEMTIRYHSPHEYRLVNQIY